MSSFALLLLLSAALLHAGWNLILKRAGDRLLVTWWALVVGAALAAPLLLVRPALPAAVWPYALVSAVAEAAYFELLALVALPLVLWRYGGAALVAALRAQWLSIGLIGALTLASYALVLSAYAIAPVSYGGAIRELSIVLGAGAGWLWLGEEFGALRLAGSAVMVVGIALIDLFG